MSNSIVNSSAAQDDVHDWVEVCKLDDLTPYDGVCSLVQGRQIALFRYAGEDSVYAAENYDPIGKASVLSRGFIGDVGGRRVIVSPLYKHHYDLVTGECLEESDKMIDIYPTRVIEGVVQVGL